MTLQRAILCTSTMLGEPYCCLSMWPTLVPGRSEGGIAVAEHRLLYSVLILLLWLTRIPVTPCQEYSEDSSPWSTTSQGTDYRLLQLVSTCWNCQVTQRNPFWRRNWSMLFKLIVALNSHNFLNKLLFGPLLSVMICLMAKGVIYTCLRMSSHTECLIRRWARLV